MYIYNIYTYICTYIHVYTSIWYTWMAMIHTYIYTYMLICKAKPYFIGEKVKLNTSEKLIQRGGKHLLSDTEPSKPNLSNRLEQYT